VSRFDDAIAGVLGDHLHEFGRVDVRYLDEPNADPVELILIEMEPEQTEEIDDSTGRKLRITQRVMISTDPDCEYGGVANPKVSAKIEKAGIAWAITPPIRVTNNGFAVLTISRSPQIERGRRGYRGHGG